MKSTLAVVAVLAFVFVPSAFGWRHGPTSIGAWSATARCESGMRWHLTTGNGFYGALQFDHWTWIRFGGGRFAYNAHLATPYQQVLVASRVTYDAWPNCPNP